MGCEISRVEVSVGMGCVEVGTGIDCVGLASCNGVVTINGVGSCFVGWLGEETVELAVGNCWVMPENWHPATQINRNRNIAGSCSLLIINNPSFFGEFYYLNDISMETITLLHSKSKRFVQVYFLTRDNDL